MNSSRWLSGSGSGDKPVEVHAVRNHARARRCRATRASFSDIATTRRKRPRRPRSKRRQRHQSHQAASVRRCAANLPVQIEGDVVLHQHVAAVIGHVGVLDLDEIQFPCGAKPPHQLAHGRRPELADLRRLRGSTSAARGSAAPAAAPPWRRIPAPAPGPGRAGSRRRRTGTRRTRAPVSRSRWKIRTAPPCESGYGK